MCCPVTRSAQNIQDLGNSLPRSQQSAVSQETSAPSGHFQQPLILETRDVTQVQAPLLWLSRGAGSSPLGRVLGRKPRVRRDTRHDVSAVRGQRRAYLVARNLLAPGKSITHLNAG